MKVKIIVEAGTDTELLEGIISAYNEVHRRISDKPDRVLQQLNRCKMVKFGTLPSYEISKVVTDGCPDPTAGG